MVNSRAKGAKGERAWANYLKEQGIEARRGQQFSGLEGKDVISDCVDGYPIHWEVKRVQNLNLGKAYSQAVRDAEEGEIPIVAHRKDRCPWLITLSADDFFKMKGNE